MESLNENVNGIQKRRLINSLVTVFILLAVFLAVETLNAIKENSALGNAPATNVISVNGTGEILAIPDVATFSFSVVEDAKTVADAQTAATAKTNTILEAMKKMGIADADIQTTDYSSYPKYQYSSPACTNGYCPQTNQTLVGYEVSQTVSIKVRKTADAGTALTTVGSLGATNISGLDFVIDNMDAVQTQARDKAVADAKTKAAALAKSLGVKLNKIVNFTEGSNPPIYYPMALDSKAMATGAGVAPTPPQVPAGENKITSNVTITYEVQ